MKKVIIKECGIEENLFTVLLDGYQMFDWKMNWKEFIMQAREEIDQKMEEWKQENIDEE